MKIPSNYTPIQITVPDDKSCNSIYRILCNITNLNNYKSCYISHLSLARTYNLIYTLLETDKLHQFKHQSYQFTPISIISAENIEFYELNNKCQIVIKREENGITEILNYENTKIWYKNGKLHRDNDLPAVIHANGTQKWYQNGLHHRDNDLPAVIHAHGTQQWYQKGLLHRDNDLPAVIYFDERQEWYKNGKLYRDNGLPAIIHKDGSQYWYQNGKLIRKYP